MQKSILLEAAFEGEDKDAKMIYRLVSKEYDKLLRRCPLNQQLEKGGKQIKSNIETFVKLEMASDNLGRCMRLKKLENPLKNRSLLKGIGYMRRFFLKRLLLRQLLRGKEDRLGLVPDKYTKRILTALFLNVRPKNPGGPETRGPAITHFDESQFRAPDFYNSTVSFIGKSRLLAPLDAAGNKTAKRSDASFEVEIMRLDHSLFGDLEVTEEGLVFLSRQKDPRQHDYRLGPTNEVTVQFNQEKRKVWFYQDVAQIVMRRYNLIWQAAEIFLRNKKSVFVVLFSKDRVRTFFGRVWKTISLGKKLRHPIEFIDELKGEFHTSRFSDDWRHKRISTFDYLMKLNLYGARSFQDLSQYPVFPWILANYSTPELNLADPQNFRDLGRPAAALSDRKIREGDTKYDNTDDFPDGRFQFGTHYLPGRVVLAYLMRLQPFTLMIDRFDVEGDLPARHFHVLETLWHNIYNESDSNYELVPEFFYNPELFVNQYAYLLNCAPIATSTRSA